ncbi:MAG: glycoside hydrolase family 66 protein [Cellulomonas sp.]
MTAPPSQTNTATGSDVVELLPLRAAYLPSDHVQIEVRGLTDDGSLSLWSLGELVTTVEARGSGVVDLGVLPVGTYGVELTTASLTADSSSQALARTAVEVTADVRSRLRYGFVADYAPGRDLAPVIDMVRRLHLTGVQLYDWAYRHADLVAGGEDYRDALNRPVSLETVRRLTGAIRDAGSRSFGYAAVYGVGRAEWPRWEHAALLTPSGPAYGLADFLSLVDPAEPSWLDHFTQDLGRSIDAVGLDGFHLDQYGYPKRAVRADCVTVDVADSFVTLIDAVRERLPDSHLVFNNVNDFPTWRTGKSPQDAVYIEVWEPHVTLGSLGHVVARARGVGDGKPVVIAAYQHVYDSAPAVESDLATAFTMATLFSHGATQLLAGDGDRILVDPYYVRNHTVEPSTAALLQRWYDFLVEHDALLLDPSVVDVTGAYAGAYNDDADVTYAHAAVAREAEAGAVWRRVARAGNALVVHLVNLVGQEDTLWDAPRLPVGHPGPGTLRVRRTGPGLPRVRVADPSTTPRLVEVAVVADGDHAVAQLPAPHVWQIVVIDDGAGQARS